MFQDNVVSATKIWHIILKNKYAIAMKMHMSTKIINVINVQQIKYLIKKNNFVIVKIVNII